MTTVPVATVPVYDATHGGISSLPAGRAAGYTTGSGDVPWTAADWAAHPGAVRICQDPAASDTTADVLDVESGAATLADCAPWYRAAALNWATGARAGQRRPAIYCSLSAVTPVVDVLIAHGVTAGPALWVANWNLTEAEATAIVATGGGPFPVIGVQYRSLADYDVSVFSVPWLAAVSGHPAPAPAANWTETLVQTLPTLSQGAAGDDVRTLQALLIARAVGHAITVDGAFGPATRSALQAFQFDRKLSADGIAGPVTWPKLLNR